MEYNTSLDKLTLYEYGRNIQKLVGQAVEIEDTEKRKKFVDGIIHLMGNMYPYLRDLKDFKHKLWDHLIIMSKFKLQDDSPFSEVPSTSTFSGPPEKVPYKIKNFKYKHFGRNILDMLKYAAELKEGEEKSILTALVANHMKKLYLTWSKDIVEDKFIYKKMEELTNGKLVVSKDLVLSSSDSLVQEKHKKRISDTPYSSSSRDKYSNKQKKYTGKRRTK